MLMREIRVQIFLLKRHKVDEKKVFMGPVVGYKENIQTV